VRCSQTRPLLTVTCPICLSPRRPLLQVAGIQSTYQEAAAATKAAHERAEALRGQLHAASGQLHLLQQQMQGIREAGRSKLAAFGGKPVVALVAAIGRAKGQFSRPPIGPMGQHLTLEDTRWGWGGADRAVWCGAWKLCVKCHVGCHVPSVKAKGCGLVMMLALLPLHSCCCILGLGCAAGGPTRLRWR
jgi:hypothetical protein